MQVESDTGRTCVAILRVILLVVYLHLFVVVVVCLVALCFSFSFGRLLLSLPLLLRPAVLNYERTRVCGGRGHERRIFLAGGRVGF